MSQTDFLGFQFSSELQSFVYLQKSYKFNYLSRSVSTYTGFIKKGQ